MPSKSYRQLNAPDLCEWFTALHPRAYVAKGRDSHLLRRFLDAEGVAPTQVLEGMVYGFGCASVPIFLQASDAWLLPDPLQQEAELAVWLSGERPPPFYHDYVDLKDTGVQHAQQEAAFRAARARLEGWVDEALNAPALSLHHPRVRRLLQRRETA